MSLLRGSQHERRSAYCYAERRNFCYA